MAFGVLVYEMPTGLPLFSGESVPHILADVLRMQPDWNRLPKNLHPRLRLMLERCLEKRPRTRYHAIADARTDIEVVLSDPQGVIVRAGYDGAGGAVARPLTWAQCLKRVFAIDIEVCRRCGEGFRFLLEARGPIRILGERCGQHLDRDVACERCVVGAIHLAHAAGADRLADVVSAETRASSQCHLSVSRPQTGAGDVRPLLIRFSCTDLVLASVATMLPQSRILQHVGEGTKSHCVYGRATPGPAGRLKMFPRKHRKRRARIAIPVEDPGGAAREVLQFIRSPNDPLHVSDASQSPEGIQRMRVLLSLVLSLALRPIYRPSCDTNC